MIDYAGLLKDMMVADNRAFIRHIHEKQDREKQELEKKESWEGFEFREKSCDICDNQQNEME